MNNTPKWAWNEDPIEPGWYATTHCWDVQEGMFPDANYWDGEKWQYQFPVIGYAGLFEDEEKAKDWAIENDVEL